MQWSLERRIGAGFGAALVFLAVLGVVAYQNATSALAANHSYDVDSELAATLSQAQDMETGTRGYLLTGDASYLAPYHSGLTSLPNHLARLRALTADDSAAAAPLAQLDERLQQELPILQQLIDLRDSGSVNLPREQPLLDAGKAVMDDVRASVATLQAHEAAALEPQTAELRGSARNLIIAFAVATLLSLILLAMVYRAARRDAAARRQTDAVRDRLLAAEQAAHEAAEAAGQRLAVLAEAGTLLAESLDYETTLRNVGRLATRQVADWCDVHVLWDDGTVQQVTMSPGDADGSGAADWPRRPLRHPAPAGSVDAVIATGVPQVFAYIDDSVLSDPRFDPEHVAPVRALGLQALIIMPLRARDRTLGTLTLAAAGSGRWYDPADVKLAEELASRAALAIDNARLYREAARQRAEATVTLASIGDAVIATDTAARITFMNPVAESLTGWSRADAAGRPLTDAFRIVNAETRAPAVDLVARVLAEGHIVGLANRTILIARDGTERPIDDSAAPIRDEAGAIYGVVLVFRDASIARELAEQTRREAAAAVAETTRLARILDHLPTAVFLAEGDLATQTMRWTYLNPAAQEQMGAADITPAVVTPTFEICDGDGRLVDEAALPMDQALWTGRGVAGQELVLRYRDGQRRVILAASVVTRDDPASREAVVVARDITERRRNEDMLRFLNAAGREFGASLDYESTLATVARLAVPDIADSAVVDLLQEAKVHRVVIAAADPEQEARLRELQQSYGPDPRNLGVAEVLRTGTALLVETLTAEELEASARDPEHARLLATNGTCSSIIVPFLARGRVLGALTLAMAESGRRYTDSDLILVEELAHLAALAIDNARLFQEVQGQAQRFAITLASIGDGVIATDSQGCVTFMNPVAEQQTGWTQREGLGRPLDTVLCLTDPATATPRALATAQILEDGRTLDLADHAVLRGRDGVRRVIADSGAPIRDPNGAIVGAVVVFHDETAQQAGAEALRASEERYRSVIAVLEEGIVVRDREGQVETMNVSAARILGFPEEAVRDVHMAGSAPVAIHEDGTPVAAAEWPAMETLRTGQPQSGVVLGLPQPNGKPTWIAVNSRPLVRPGEPTPYAVVTSLADITAQRAAGEALRAREAAEEANRAKSEFLSRMSHELRTPLNSILGFGQLLAMSTLTPDQAESLHYIQIAGQHLLELINEVLDIARIEADRLAISPEPVDLAELVTACLNLIGPLAARRELEMPDGLPTGCSQYVRADHQRLQQVLLNILNNAVKYNRPGGYVTVVCAEAVDGRVRWGIRDTGLGLTAAQCARLFTPFDRLGAEHTGVEGTGLGLTLSRHLMAAMDGTLTVESTPGHGSTFWLELPAAENPVQQLAKTVPAPPPAGPSQGPARHVLYIEDNLANFTLIERLVAHRPGVEVQGAMLGRLGIELAREHRPDLILLDLHLPDMGGEAVLQELRADVATRSIPVVVLSADATHGQVARLQAGGATAYLTKPIDVPRFLGLLDELLEREGVRK